MAGEVGFDGADEEGFAVGGLKELFEEEGGCGLAVGAGDGGEGEAALGMVVELGGEFGEGAAAVGDEGEGEFGLLFLEVGEGAGGVGEDGGGALLEGFVDEEIAVGGVAGHGDEGVPEVDAAGVVVEVAEGDVGAAGGGEGGDGGEGFVPLHEGECTWGQRALGWDGVDVKAADEGAGATAFAAGFGAAIDAVEEFDEGAEGAGEGGVEGAVGEEEKGETEGVPGVAVEEVAVVETEAGGGPEEVELVSGGWVVGEEAHGDHGQGETEAEADEGEFEDGRHWGDGRWFLVFAAR